MQVEVAGLRCLGVHEQPPAPDPGAELCGAADDVGEGTGAESSAFVSDRHTESSQKSGYRRPSNSIKTVGHPSNSNTSVTSSPMGTNPSPM
jgi:hypothetical protein